MPDSVYRTVSLNDNKVQSNLTRLAVKFDSPNCKTGSSLIHGFNVKEAEGKMERK